MDKDSVLIKYNNKEIESGTVRFTITDNKLNSRIRFYSESLETVLRIELYEMEKSFDEERVWY